MPGEEIELPELTKTRGWWLAARDRVKEVIDGPDPDIDRIIQAILDNSCKVPSTLVAHYPTLQERQIAAAVENAVASKSTDRKRS